MYKKIFYNFVHSALIFILCSSLHAELPKQVNVDQAQHIFDANGVPILVVEDFGEIENPAFVALYALAYAGISYSEKYENLDDENKFNACIAWLEAKLIQKSNDSAIWEYNFDHTYNNISVKSPWTSAFMQAVGIEAFIEAYHKTQNDKFIILASKAARALITPISNGGMMFEENDDIWFEEICQPNDNPSHILNGHMRALIALDKLLELKEDAELRAAFDKGLDTLVRWMPKYDTGYWLRYDLNTRKNDLFFRFNNPFGFLLPELAISDISLVDPKSKKKTSINIGSKTDSQGAARIAGKGWGQRETLDGKSVRRLVPTLPDDYSSQLDGSVYHAPETYFYVNLPSEDFTNTRDDWLELTITYKDEKESNLSVQTRSIAPGPAFQWLRDGDLLLTGSGEWREWKIPIRPSDLGFFCGSLYGKKHLDYLSYLAEIDTRLEPWVLISRGYLNVLVEGEKYKRVNIARKELPMQTVTLPIMLPDSEGVLRQCIATPDTQFDENGLSGPGGNIGTPVYGAIITSYQALAPIEKTLDSLFDQNDRFLQKLLDSYETNKYLHKYYSTKDEMQSCVNKISSAAALKNMSTVYLFDGDTGGALWTAEFANSYNDVTIPAGWSSSFYQSYVIKAFQSAIDSKRKDLDIDYENFLQMAIKGYFIDISKNGFLAKTHYGLPFFQEFSKSPMSQINAHLCSLATLGECKRYKISGISDLIDNGIETLKAHFHLFDCGYWMRYDLNPKKEILCQIDWIEGEESPLISSLEIMNPQTLENHRVDVAGGFSMSGASPMVVGTDWSPSIFTESSDDKMGRGFINGYKTRSEPVPKGAQHNVYLWLRFPPSPIENIFSVPTFIIKLRYKDRAPGRFMLKLKPICLNDFENFVPFRESQIVCIGDKKWKTATIVISPRDLGWFVGPDYQRFHAEQLQHIADQRSDWYFDQLAKKHKYLLDRVEKGEMPVVPSEKSSKSKPQS